MFFLDIRQGSEYALISEYTKVLNILHFGICQVYTRFWIKYFVIHVWQYSEYALDSEYATVLNMLGSHKVVNKIFHHKHLTGFWICLELWKYQCYTGFCRKQHHRFLTAFQMFLRFWTCHIFKYARVTQGSQQNALL